MTQPRLNRRSALLLAGALAGMAFRPAHAQTESGPAAPIRQLCNGLLEAMKMGQREPFQVRSDLLGPIIDQVFDLAAILEVSVGAAWNMLSANDRQLLSAAFRRYTVASYVNSFDHYNGQRFDIAPQTREVANGEQVVETKIINGAGESHELDYVMRETGNAWRVVDVLAEGAISRVAVQRSDFRRLLTRGGAEALAKSLQQKTADLSGGMGR